MKVIPGKASDRKSKDSFADYAEAFNSAIDAFIQLDEVRAHSISGSSVFSAAALHMLTCHMLTYYRISMDTALLSSNEWIKS